VPYTPQRTRSTEIRERLDHPVVDCDSHLREFLPEWLDYMVKVGGRDWADRYLAKVGADLAEAKTAGLGPNRDFGSAALYTSQERRKGRIRRGPWWGMPVANPADCASPYLPKLLVSRLDELGMDFLITYPTWGQTVHAIPDDEDQLIATRAVNEMHAEVWNGNSEIASRVHVPAVIPMHTPLEAIGELEHCVQTLKFKAIKIPAMVPRTVQSLAERFPGIEDCRPDAVWADCYGLDSEYDYDPFWQRCTELGVAVTCHGAAAHRFPWKSRSISNFTFNHIGNQPWMQEMLCKSLYMGGVTARFPRLNFAFLEGGVGWACVLLNDIVQHWNMRSVDALELLNPANLDRDAVNALLNEYGGERFKGRLDQVVQLFPDSSEPIEPENYNDYRHTGAARQEDLAPLFENFYFGCEADDKINAWAFDTKVNRFAMRLKALFGSDIGHMDAPDFTRVVEETYELVEDDVLTPDEYRLFVADHAILLHGRMNASFFHGTAIEAYANKVLANDSGWKEPQAAETRPAGKPRPSEPR
jgi:predicted TIM-barrel fold metal-dependent hydrolase